jgi:hypothetical protein
MKTTNGNEVTEKQIRLAASNFLYNKNLSKAYLKLLNVLGQGKKNDLAANYVKVIENLDSCSVKDMIDMIESAVLPVKMKKDKFFDKIDWELLRRQKAYLLEYEPINGVIELLSEIQDYAVDELGFPEELVFKSTEE